MVFSCPGLVAEEKGRALLRGLVTDASSTESLPGASIFVREAGRGTTTDVEGRFQLYLPEGNHQVEVSYVGYQTQVIHVDLKNQAFITVTLSRGNLELSEVVVEDHRSGAHVERTEMGVVRLPSQTIRQIPAMMGEVDLIRSIQLLPGVQSVGEGSTGFNVRGGGMDQNLILMDQATVYNASHLMGFFSVFNNDVVKDINLYKGNIPAEHGGRLSSLLDVRIREGDMQTYRASGGIGTISSRLMLEGPIVQDRVSFIAAGRRSYADLFLPLASDPNIQGHKLFFYDLNTKINARLDDKNRFQLSSYMGQDVFRFGQQDPFTISWGNSTHSLRWNRIMRDDWLLNVTLLYTGYDYSLKQEGAGTNFIWDAGNKDIGLKTDFGWFPNENNTIKFGFSSLFHEFNPGIFRGIDDDSMYDAFGSTGSNALSHALFASNEQKVNDRWALEYGLRFSAFQSMGPSTGYNFDEQYNYIDSTEFGRGEIYNTWWGFEPRAGLRYTLNAQSSVKASYNRTLQYLHLASYSDGGNPLDIWVPSSKMVKPQIGNQYSVGYFRNLELNQSIVESSVEVFYKSMDNQIDFKDNAWLMLNPKIEGEFRFGQAWAYGAEFLLRKNEGRFHGWISYTWSRAERQIEEINNGNPYPASYDRTHNLSLVTNYELSPRITLSATWVYTTGAPVTLPSGRFEYGGQINPVYTERNDYRLPDYHRLDLGMSIRSREKPDRNFRSEWNISLYNAYYRKNTWMIDFRSNEDQKGQVDAYNVYLFPILPSVTYNFYF